MTHSSPPSVYNLPSDIETLAHTLLTHQHMLSCAESCTGGLIAASCTALAGSSQWFERGFVTYSNAAKQESLGVPAALIAKHGAVSQPVAHAMAQGALLHSHAHWSIAITGIAGPTGGTADKPIGLVWFGFAHRSSAQTTQPELFTLQTQYKIFSGNREAIRNSAVHHAIASLTSLITKNNNSTT